MRLIDAENLNELEDLLYEYSPERNGEPWYMAKDVWECIEKAPTIEVPTWIPVTERLPVKGGYYLVVARYGITIMEFTMGNERYMEKPSFVSELLGRCNGEVTHWMPLPTPPKDGDT